MIWFAIAWRNLFRNARRTLFAAGVITVAVVSLMAVYGYIQSTFYHIREGAISSGVGHFQIGKGGAFHGYEEYPLETGLSVDEARRLSARINEAPAVRNVLPRLTFDGLLSNGERSLFVAAQGVDVVLERRLSRSAVRIIEGRDFDPLGSDPENSVIVGSELARLLGAGPGSTLTIMAPTVLGGLNAIDVDVLGVATSGAPAFDKVLLLAPITLAQDLLQTDKISRLAVVLRRTDDTAATIANLENTFAAEGDAVVIRSWRALTPIYDQLVSLYGLQFIVFGSILAIVAFLSVLNVMTMSVLERTREIGTLRGLGLPKGAVVATFVWEGALVGLFGAAAGVAAFFAISFLTSVFPIPMPPPPARSVGYPLSLPFLPDAALVLTFAAVALGFVSARISLWRIAKLSIREALTHV